MINELHIPMSFCVYFVIDNSVPDYTNNQLPLEPYIYRGKNAAEKFMEYLVKIVNFIGSLLHNVTPIKMTEDDKYRFKSATHCEMCKREFIALYRPVRDRCHLSGIYRSALRNNCNL